MRQRPYQLGCWVGVLWPLIAASAAEGRVIGKIDHVGFPASVGDVVREGDWVPITVDLSLEGQTSFEGFLRVGQRDKDGDIAYDQTPVQLRSDSGGGPGRRYVLYVVAGPRSGQVFVSVDLLDTDGNVVELVCDGELTRSLEPAQQPARVSDDHFLMLELSAGGISQTHTLVSAEQADRYDRQIVLAHIQPSDLPDRWLGLDMVDCVIWERADATKLTLQQLTALVEWVRQGGCLMVASSSWADTLAKSDVLAPILPVKIGQVRTATEFPNLRKRLLAVVAEDDAGAASYAEPVTFVQCQTRAGAEEVLREPGLESTIVAQRQVGRGRVIFVAGHIGDLMPTGGGVKPVEFFKRTLELREARGSEDTHIDKADHCFSHLDNAVGFRKSTGLYLLGAILFSLAYVAAATFGSWGFLRSRRWTRHAWSAFGVVAGAAAVLSLLAAQSMRGVGRSLHQLCIVDGVAGDTEATASAYFGIKTGTHTVLNVWMPSDYTAETEPIPTNCSLKPMPSSAHAMAAGSSYADPARYRLFPASAQIRDVPVRATLKQFEGRWSGELRQTIQADVRVGQQRSRDDETVATGVLEGSTITNELDHPLTNCFLIHPLQDAYTSFVARGPRHAWIRVYPLGNIAEGEQIDLAARMYADRKSQPGILMDVKDWEKWTLGEAIKNWDRGVRAGMALGGGSEIIPNLDLEPHQDALLLLTALSEHEPTTLPGTFNPGYDFSRRHCRQLDRSAELTSDVVMFIGFAEDQGPVMLCTGSGSREYRPLLADWAQTMYRFIIPVKHY